MSPAKFQQICIEAEDLRTEVQKAYRRGDMTDGDAVNLLRMVREITAFINSKKGSTHETSPANLGDRAVPRIG